MSKDSLASGGSGRRPTAEEGQQLCLSCGMCCNGDIHKRSLLLADEVPAARALGLPIVDIGGRPAFRQPCPHHIEDRCSVYRDERKPHVCGSYQCSLLKKFLGGDIEIEQCLESVRQTRALISDLRKELGLDRTESIWSQLTNWSEDDSPKKPDTRMRIGLLMRLVVKVFLPPDTVVGPYEPPPEARPSDDPRDQAAQRRSS